MDEQEAHIEQTSRSIPRVEVPYYIRGLALGLPAYLIGIHLWTWLFLLPVFLGGRADFRQLYIGGYMLRTGHAHELYDYMAQKRFEDLLVSPAQVALPVNHLAYEELLFMPFSLMSYRTAYFAFLAFNLLLLAVSFHLLRPRMSNLARIFRWLPAAMYLSFLPVAAALMQGQDSIVLLALLSAALVSLDRRREFLAGILVACCLFKFQIALPIAFLFFTWRYWRFCVGFVFAAVTLISLSLWMVGIRQAVVYARSLLAMSVRLDSGVTQFIYGISPRMMINLRGLIFGLANAHLSNVWIQLITLVTSSLLIVCVAIWCSRNQLPGDRFVLAIAASAVVSYHLFFPDLSIMLIPIIVILDRFVMAEASDHRSARPLVCASALMFVAPVAKSYIPDHLYLAALPLCSFLYVLMRHFRSKDGSTIASSVANSGGVVQRCLRAE